MRMLPTLCSGVASLRSASPAVPVNRTRRQPRRAAMTLLEILVVVAIIAVMVAILVPALSRAKERVRGISCQSNMNQLIRGTLYYVADHKVLPGTHSLFYFQSLFGGPAWPRPSGVTRDGARDRLVGLIYIRTTT